MEWKAAEEKHITKEKAAAEARRVAKEWTAAEVETQWRVAAVLKVKAMVVET